VVNNSIELSACCKSAAEGGNARYFEGLNHDAVLKKPPVLKPVAEEQQKMLLDNESHPQVSFSYEASLYVNSITASDFDNDSYSDIAYVSGDGNIYFVSGLTKEVINSNSNSSAGFRCLEMADFDLDGIDDIVAGSYGGEISFIDGRTGLSLHYVRLTLETRVETLAIADFNMDLVPDVAAGINNTVVFIDGFSGEIMFNNTAPENRVYDLAIGDFDNNTVPDVAAASRDSNIYFINGSNGELMRINSDPPDRVYVLEAGDFNGDNITDIAATGYYPSVFFIDGLTGLTMYENTDPQDYILNMATGDFNNDSILDIAAGSDDSNIYFISGDGLTYRVYEEPTDWIEGMVADDFTLDGVPDLAIGCDDSNVYIVNGLTGETLFIDDSPSSAINFAYDGLHSLATGDFNNDTYPDVVSTSETVIHFTYTDTFEPILKYLNYPELLVSESLLEFSIEFDEISLDTLIIGYKDNQDKTVLITNTLDSLTIEEKATNLVSFIIPPVMYSPLKLWFTVNDTWGNTATYGNETNSIEIQMNIKRLFENTDPLYSINTLESADFNLDGIDDVVVSSDDYGLYFINGESGQSMYQNWDLLDLVTSLEIADFTGDSIPDVAAGTEGGSVYFINGSDGQTLYINNDATDGVFVLDKGDFNNDTVTDIVAGSYDSNIYFIDGLSGSGMFTNTDPPDWIRSLTAVDFTGDGIVDVVAGTTNGTVHFINGTDGATLFVNDDPADEIWSITAGDFDQDSIVDIAIGSKDSNLYIINGSSGETLAVYDAGDWVVDILATIDGTSDTSGTTQGAVYNDEAKSYIRGAADFNSDGTADLVLGIANNVILIFDGKTNQVIFRITIPELVSIWEPFRFAIADMNFDSHPDLVAARNGWDGIYIINGLTGKFIDVIAVQDSVTCQISVTDRDNNGVPDIVYGDSKGKISAVQSLSPFKTLTPKISLPSTFFTQGTSVSIQVNVTDFFANPVNGSTVELAIQKEGSEVFHSILGQDQSNGSHLFHLYSGDFEIGTWNLYPVVTSPPYDRISLTDYQDINGNYHPSDSFAIIGRAVSTYTVVSETGTFIDEDNLIKDVVESSKVSIKIKLYDEFNHPLYENDATIRMAFNTTERVLDFTGEGTAVAITGIDTKGMSHGKYPINLTITGQYLVTSEYSLELNVLPRFPELEYTNDFLTIVFLIFLAGYFILFLSLKKIFNLLELKMYGTEEEALSDLDLSGDVGDLMENVLVTVRKQRLPEWIEKNREHVHKPLGRLIKAIFVFFLLMCVMTAFVFFYVKPIWSFLLFFLTFGVVIILIFFQIFKLIHEQLLDRQFSYKKWFRSMPVIFIFMFLLLTSVIIVADQIEWFNLYISQETIDLLGFSIPSIYWDVGVVGFLSGFVLVILSVLYDSREDIEHLNNLVDDFYSGMYPKKVNIVEEAITGKARSKFISLATQFVLWYFILAYTFVSKFQLLTYIPLISMALLPLQVIFILFFVIPYLFRAIRKKFQTKDVKEEKRSKKKIKKIEEVPLKSGFINDKGTGKVSEDQLGSIDSKLQEKLKIIEDRLDESEEESDF